MQGTGGYKSGEEGKNFLQKVDNMTTWIKENKKRKHSEVGELTECPPIEAMMLNRIAILAHLRGKVNAKSLPIN